MCVEGAHGVQFRRPVLPHHQHEAAGRLGTDMNSATKIRLDHAELLLLAPTSPPSGRAVRAGCFGWLSNRRSDSSGVPAGRKWPTARGGPSCSRCKESTDADTQHRVCDLWNTLSRAGHHHQYELAPTETELRRWLNEARLLTAQLEDQP